MATIDQFKTLSAVVETGSFRAASEKLHKAQSAISYGIKTLEDEYNLILFNREGYRPVLTDAGRSVYQKAKELLSKNEELNQLSEYLAEGKEAEIDLAINGIGPFIEIIKVLKQFTFDNPKTQLKLSVENLSGTVEKIMEDTVDFGLAETSAWNEQLEKIRWARILFYPVCSPDFYLMQLGRTIQMSDFSNQVQVVVKDSGQHTKATAGVLSNCNHWTVNDFATKKQLILSGLGWGYIPIHQVQDELANKKLVKIKTNFLENLLIDFFLIKKRNRILKPMATNLWNLFKKNTCINK